MKFTGKLAIGIIFIAVTLIAGCVAKTSRDASPKRATPAPPSN